MANLDEIKESLIKGKAPIVKELTQKAVNEGVPVEQILNGGLIAGMAVIGERFKKNEIYVPEVLIAARAMHAGMAILKPLLAASGVKPIATIVLGTVKGDLHDIGKNLVGMMLEGAGFKVVDAGIDVSAEKFVEVVTKENAKIIAMSALLTTTMPMMKTVVDGLAAAGLKGKIKTMIGGAPVTQKYAEEIGADGYGKDASSAVDVAKSLVTA
jgi:5-methyltetrahydrofolate--homocysteine methyltransferase